MKKFLSTFTLLLFVFGVNAQKEDSLFIRRIADEILMNGKAYDDLRVLTKQIGGRLSGSPQMVKAEQWGLKLFQSLNPDRAWLQECMVPHWVRGGHDEAVASYKVPSTRTSNATKTLDVLALGNSLGSGKNGVTGNVIEVKSFEDLESKKDQLKGKIVFYNYHFNQKFVRTFEAYGDAVKYRGAGPSEAAKYGDVAEIVRSMSESTDNNPHTGSLRYDSAYKMIPAVAIGLQDADWLSNQLKKENVSVQMKTYGHFLPDTIGHNVIAELKGSEFPNEYITIGGHLDSWDPAEGAHDDGTGVVQTIEVLRVLKTLGYQPKHTIRFVLFANEENGTRGGRKYSEEALTKGEKHIFALETDAGGFTPRGIGITGTEQQYQKVLSWQHLLCPYGACEIERGGGGSDIGFLARANKAALGEYIPDSQRYFDLHHARNDVFEAVNKRELELGAVNIAALIYLVDKYGL
jgi:acetylornithine deacetylase/succinyl-diaminopimelate desuccinylase-like protein